jgi:hypothetical protein
VLHCYTATFGIFNEKVMEMNKEMYLTEHLVLPSEATLSQTSELDGVRKLSIHLRRGLALGSGPDEKVAERLYVSTRPQCEAFAAGAERSARRICGGADQ